MLKSKIYKEMAKVLIVSKTKLKNGVCIGGINLNNGEFVRIHGARGENLPSDAPYEIGDVWEMDIKKAWNCRPKPHVEDKQVTSSDRIGNVGDKGIISCIHQNESLFGDKLTKGCLGDTFQGCLHLEAGKAFVEEDKVPEFSTQFWIPDEDLIRRNVYGSVFYTYGGSRIKFVGLQPPKDRILSGSIVRLSLANWWNGDSSGKNRCYLQLSGWYGNEHQKTVSSSSGNELRFINTYTLSEFRQLNDGLAIELLRAPSGRCFFRCGSIIGAVSNEILSVISKSKNSEGLRISEVQADGDSEDTAPDKHFYLLHKAGN